MSILPLIEDEHDDLGKQLRAALPEIAHQLGIPINRIVVTDTRHEGKPQIVVAFGQTIIDQETGAARPDVRLLRLYLRKGQGYLPAFLERRVSQKHGSWAVVCNDSHVSANVVAAMWKARGYVADDAVKTGRPDGPAPGRDPERWLRLAKEIGPTAALSEYKASIPSGRGTWVSAYQWWYRHVRPRLPKLN